MTSAEITDPEKVALRKQIIRGVLDEFDVTRDELLGNGRSGGLMEARRKAAERLKDAGFNISRIARILRRNHTTICNYFLDEMRERKRDRVRLAKLLEVMPDDVRKTIESVAIVEAVHPYTVLKEWVCERARYEAEAKARSAA